MIRFLQISFFICAFSISHNVTSQSSKKHFDLKMLNSSIIHSSIDMENEENVLLINKNNISDHIFHSEEKVHSDHEQHQNHSHMASLLDVILSENASDFNCSGGFCMMESHHHKKGLSVKKQLFKYFMSISC